MKAYIYRIQNMSGIGPYKALFPCDTSEPIADENLKHWFFRVKKISNYLPPPPFDEEINRPMDLKKEICGFLNMEQVTNWFSDTDRRYLSKSGFILQKVPVKTITAQSKFQALAIKTNKE